MVPKAGLEPARCRHQRILSFTRYTLHRRNDRLLGELNGTPKASIFKGFEVLLVKNLDL